MPDGLSRMYANLVDGTYDCVDRMTTAEEAEVGSAGEQPAKEYFAGNSF